jgi:hypothetical protein
LEKFVHELNALWKLSGSSMGALRELVAVAGIDFMCPTMINPATSWFEIVELPTVAQEMTVPPAGKVKKGNI